MKTPKDKKISFLFVSLPVKDLSNRWTARVTFPPASTDSTVIQVEVLDGEEKIIDKAVVGLFGLKLKVQNGLASLTCAQFIEGLRAERIWLHREGRESVPGGLTFG